MKLTDIQVKTKISISITTPQRSFDLESEIEELSDYERKILDKTIKQKGMFYTIIASVKEGDKVVGFPTGAGYSYAVSCSIGDKYYSWEPVLIKPVSEFGIDKLVHVVYIDSENTNFKLTGKVVSITELSPKKYLVGCKFLNKSAAVDKYVSQKQIERARDRRK